jgi:uncharacterized protein
MVAANFLIDTGAILAILDRKDRWHSKSADAFRQLRLPGMTSEAVLTEVFHLLQRSRIGIETAWAFMRSGAIVLGSIADSELQGIQSLMSEYSDLPMDFADATLVHLAKRESIYSILTVDQDDFRTYRIAGKQTFRILPVDRPK